MNGEHLSLRQDQSVYQPAVERVNGVPAYNMETHAAFHKSAREQERQYANFAEKSSKERENQHLEVFAIDKELTIINNELQPFIDSLETYTNHIEALNQKLLQSVEQEKPAVKTLLQLKTHAISAALKAILSESQLIRLALHRTNSEKNNHPRLNRAVINQIEHWKVQMLSLKERFNAVTIAISQLTV